MKTSIRAGHIVRDFLAFGMTVASAIIFNWQVRDLVWGLWASSLCVGYAFIVVAIFAGVFREKNVFKFLALGFSGMFLLAFFTVHFGGFHWGYSAILNKFFPLTEETEEKLPNILITTSIALKLYWPMVASSVLSRLHDFQSALHDKDVNIIKPYVNVFRMHVLIFVLAGFNAAHASRIMLFFILAFYFFPWGVLFTDMISAWKAAKAGKTKLATTEDPAATGAPAEQ